MITSFNLSPIKKILPVSIKETNKDLNDSIDSVGLVSKQVTRNTVLAKHHKRSIGLMNTVPQTLNEINKTGNKPSKITKIHLKIAEAFRLVLINKNLAGNNIRDRNASRDIKPIRKKRMKTVEFIGEKKICLSSSPQ